MDRSDLIERGRAIWALTASSNEHERGTANAQLDRFLQQHTLTLLELAPAPHPQVRDGALYPAQATPLRPPPSPSHSRPPHDPFHTPYDFQHMWTEATRQAGQGPRITWQDNNIFTASAGSWQDFSTRFDYGTPPTLEKPPRERWAARMDDKLGLYNIHWWKEWGLFGYVGRASGTNHTWVGIYGEKWQQTLNRFQHEKLPYGWLDEVQQRLSIRGSSYKLTTYVDDYMSWPAVTELSGEFEQDWIEMDPDDFCMLYQMLPEALEKMLTGIVQAARQFEAKTRTT